MLKPQLYKKTVDILYQEEKEIVWLPKSLAAKVKNMEEGKVLEAEIIKYFEESKDYIQADVESLDDAVLQYRGYMIKAKNAFREAKEEQLNSTYALWEKFEEDMKGIRDYVVKAKAEITPLKNELSELKEMMLGVDKWGIKDLLELVKQLNSNFYGETKEMLSFLMNNYKKP